MNNRPLEPGSLQSKKTRTTLPHLPHTACTWRCQQWRHSHPHSPGTTTAQSRWRRCRLHTDHNSLDLCPPGHSRRHTKCSWQSLNCRRMIRRGNRCRPSPLRRCTSRPHKSSTTSMRRRRSLRARARGGGAHRTPPVAGNAAPTSATTPKHTPHPPAKQSVHVELPALAIEPLSQSVQLACPVPLAKVPAPHWSQLVCPVSAWA